MSKKLRLSEETRSNLSKLVSPVEWDGVVTAEPLSPDLIQIRNAIADAARNCEWPQVLELATNHPERINTIRLGGTSLYSPLHQAAYAGASVEVVSQLVEKGAWRTLQNALGERPVDVAEKRGHRHLIELLTPIYKHLVPLGVLLKVQANFHGVILGRAKELVEKQGLRLPQLESLLELDRPEMWFPVPDMYGGFNFRLERPGVEAKLVSESWCRVAGGSGQRHEITSAGSKLVDEGFV